MPPLHYHLKEYLFAFSQASFANPSNPAGPLGYSTLSKNNNRQPFLDGLFYGHITCFARFLGIPDRFWRLGVGVLQRNTTFQK